MKGVVVALLLLLVTVAVCFANKHNWHKEFEGYVSRFSKKYSAGSDEYNRRLGHFIDNMQEAGRLKARNPLATFGPTIFSDHSKEEFANLFLGYVHPKEGFNLPTRDIDNEEPHRFFRTPTYEYTTYGDGGDGNPSDGGSGSGNPSNGSSGGNFAPNPTTWDWSQAGVVTPVNDQGQCGCCWAWSAMETVESYHALRTGNLVPLSAEQLVDCDTQQKACGGGFPITTYQYIQSVGGIATASAYPYTAGQTQVGGRCRSVTPAVSVTGIFSLQGESGMYKQLSSPAGGPVSVCVAASTWQNYQGGIVTSCDTTLNHAVQVTGYENWGTSNAVWRVRNQWSTNWGEQGYMRILAGQNLCLIATCPNYVTTS